MVKDDGKAGKSKKTLETQNPHGKMGKEDADGPSLGGSGDSQSGKGMENGSWVSADGKQGDFAGVDGGDGIGMTLIELSSKRGRKRGIHQVKAGKEASKIGDGGETDAKITSMSGGNSAILRRSSRKRIVVDPGDYSKNLKKGEDREKRKDEEEQGEEEEEEESEFSVGDFVWGKVKSHPWWPGRVFDPSEASQQALKYKHEGKILVAYYGGATFAWCNPSQLKPFVENFAEMSKQSSSKGFVSAVEDAVGEFGRLVELDMTCYCTPRKDESAHQQSTANAGIKGGVNVNKGGIGIYCVDRFEPAGFLADLRLVAKNVSVGNMLELTTLKSRVSAIYPSKDGHLFLKANEPQEAADDEGDGAGAEDSFRGLVEEPVQILPGILDGSKRKERSVLEILYANEKGNEDGGSVEGEQANKTDSKSGRKKRKVEHESQKKTSDEGQSLGNGSLVTQSGKSKKELTDAPKGKIDHGDNTEEGKKMERRSSRMKMKESPKPIIVENDLAAVEESEMSPRTRERKKSRYLCPPYTDLGYYRQTAVSSPRAPEAKAVESASQLTGSPPLVKCSGETFKKTLPKLDDGEHGKWNASAAQTTKRGSSRKVVDGSTKSIASSNNVLSEIRSAALSGQFRGDQSFDAVKGFLTSYRSSKYQNGSNYNPCESSEADYKSWGKGKSVKVKHRLEKEAVTQESKRVNKSRTKHEKAKSENKVNEVYPKTGGKMIEPTQSAALLLKFPPDYPLPSEDDLGAIYSKYGAFDLSKTQVSQKSSSVKLVFLRASDAEAACKSSKASNPFGAAKVSYRIRHLGAIFGDKEADENGFLKKDSTCSGLKRKARSSQKQSKASISDIRLRLVKQKLEGMATMVAEAGDGKMSEEIKSNLETRLKDLLEEVKALPALPSSSRSGV